jgi:hypothetical protein
MRVRMLVSAEGGYSLSAGRVYELPEELAESLVAGGAAEVPTRGSYAEDDVIEPGVNEPAEHHVSDYVEFPENPEAVRAEDVPPAPEAELEDGGTGEEPKDEAPAKPKRTRRKSK